MERNVASSTSPVVSSPCALCHHQTVIAELRPHRPSIVPTEKCVRSRYTCVRNTEGPRTSPVMGRLTGALLMAFTSRCLNDSFIPCTICRFNGACVEVVCVCCAACCCAAACAACWARNDCNCRHC